MPVKNVTKFSVRYMGYSFFRDAVHVYIHTCGREPNLIFLIYKNDIGEQLLSLTVLFADDLVVFKHQF